VGYTKLQRCSSGFDPGFPHSLLRGGINKDCACHINRILGWEASLPEYRYTFFLQGEEGERLRAELAIKDRKKMEEIVRKDLEDSSDEER
jgi:hypothetical protein